MELTQVLTKNRCPSCGSDNILIETIKGVHYPEDVLYSLMCTECLARTKYCEDPMTAVCEWNRFMIYKSNRIVSSKGFFVVCSEKQNS